MAATLLRASFAMADEPSTEPKKHDDPLARRVQELEERLRAVESERSTMPPPKAPDGDAKVTASSQPRGWTLTSPDRRFQTNVWGRIQARNTLVVTPDKTTEEAQVRTLRLTAQGYVVDERLRYNVQLAFGANDYERDSASPIFDAWVESTHLRDLNVRVGQFFVPLDRARTTREVALHLVDRADVVKELSLDRDVGIRFASRDLGGTKVLAYELFLGSGDGRNRATPQKPGGMVVARMVVRPWGVFDDEIEGDLSRSPTPRLALGVAGGRNWRTPRQKSTFGSTFTAGTVAYTSAAADLVFKLSGFSVIAEGLLRRASRDTLTATVGGKPVTEVTRSGAGYLVQAGMMVSGKVELVARWEQLFAREGTDPDLRATVDARGKQATGGLNVYLDGHLLKLQLDQAYAFGTDAAKAIHTTRLQLDASF